MAKRIEVIHTADRDPSINLPYAPAVKVTGGSFLFLAGVTAAKTYHHHPHIPEEFAGLPDGMTEQTPFDCGFTWRHIRNSDRGIMIAPTLP